VTHSVRSSIIFWLARIWLCTGITAHFNRFLLYIFNTQKSKNVQSRLDCWSYS